MLKQSWKNFLDEFSLLSAFFSKNVLFEKLKICIMVALNKCSQPFTNEK